MDVGSKLWCSVAAAAAALSLYIDECYALSTSEFVNLLHYVLDVVFDVNALCSCSVSLDKSFDLGLLFYTKTKSMLARFTLKTEAFDMKQSYVNV